MAVSTYIYGQLVAVMCIHLAYAYGSHTAPQKEPALSPIDSPTDRLNRVHVGRQ